MRSTHAGDQYGNSLGAIEVLDVLLDVDVAGADVLLEAVPVVSGPVVGGMVVEAVALGDGAGIASVRSPAQEAGTNTTSPARMTVARRRDVVMVAANHTAASDAQGNSTRRP